MTAREFKSRLAAGDKLAVVMHAYYETQKGRTQSGSKLARERCIIRDECEFDAAHILAALASAEAKAHAKQLEGFYEDDLKEMHASAGVKK